MLSEAIRLGEADWSRNGKVLVWQESQSGQGVLMSAALDGHAPRQLTSGRSVKANVGYGGGLIAVGLDTVYLTDSDGQLFRQSLKKEQARPVTPPGTRCCSPALSPDEKWLAYVYEQGQENGLAIVDTAGENWPIILARGHDFYMNPTWRGDGAQVAWVAWDHPRMPWYGTSLYTQSLGFTNGQPSPGEPVFIAGGENESIIQPRYRPNHAQLAFISDREDWYGIYLVDPAKPEAAARCLTERPGDHGGPALLQDMRWYDWMPSAESLVVVRNQDATTHIELVSLAGVTTSLATVKPKSPDGDPDGGADYADYANYLRPVVNPVDGRVAVFASGEKTPTRLVVLPAPDAGSEDEPGSAGPASVVVRRSGWEQTPPDQLSTLQPMQWKAADGETVHGLFAPPTNPAYAFSGKPPLVVNIHGGPTGQSLREWRPDVQFYTSRGYAFLDVNHRGSSGYGRAYRERLKAQWGVMDVSDAISGASFVCAQGWADLDRCALRGGSAGGYTVLRALTTHPDFFKAAICLYGVSDLFALTRETHKFEAHYLDSLVGELPMHAERYRERSPINEVGRIVTPLLLFQGEDDTVVPPAQMQSIMTSLQARQVPHEYHLFPGEGHGFRNKENLLTMWQAIERFLQEHLVMG